MIASVDHPPNARALRMIESVRDRLIKVDPRPRSLVTDDPPRRSPEAVPEVEWRERIIRGMTLLAMIEGPPHHPRELELLDRAAQAFGVDAAPVGTFRKLLDEKLMLVRAPTSRAGPSSSPP